MGIRSAQITTQIEDNGKPVAFEKEQPRLASLSCPEQTFDEESCFIITVSMAQKLSNKSLINSRLNDNDNLQHSLNFR